MRIISASSIGQQLADEGGTAIVMVSNKNPYFSKERIESLIRESTTRYGDVIVMLPDEPEESNYMALGYTKEKAEQRARQRFNSIANTCRKKIEALNVIDKVKVIRWENFREQPAYLEMYDRLKKLYEENAEFREDIRSTSRDILANKARQMDPDADQDVIENSLDTAAEFFIKELAFLLNASAILGKKMTANIYHREMPVMINILKGKYTGLDVPATNGWICAEVDE